ncbi:hypothetical protein LXA43DRAFT_360218 [Ganoderma leucocontextum]|nr:hypothetical protein LXA43DRAFT_360218 [Ganoderma leucocontextum]
MTPRTFDAQHFVPETMWPYVRSLRLDCNFPRLVYERNAVGRKPLNGYDAIYSALTAKLTSMPKLRTMIISHAQKGGLPWEAISAVVRIPQLRSLHIVGFLDDRPVLPPETERLLHPLITSLATIDYPSSGYRRISATEIKLFSVLLRQATTQRSLEILSIPSECAPLDCLSTTEFPRLRELSLIGRRQVITSHAGSGQRYTPYLSILAHMPRLRKLSLALAQPIDLPRQEIWPAGMEAEFPCPDLQDLLVSYPHPDDEFYSHLPSTLKCLALRCWPRHSFNFLEQDVSVMTGLGWYSPAPTSSEILRILRRCPPSSTGSVQRLELEFVEDDQARELFRLIPGAFPQLRYLIIHRYRYYDRGSEMNAAVPVATIAQALAPLQHLQALFCYLDFEHAPPPCASDYSRFYTTLQRAADEFGNALSSTVKVVGLLCRQRYGNRYVCFRIVRDDHGPGVHAECDRSPIVEIDGISVDDGRAPRREGMVGAVFVRQ